MKRKRRGRGREEEKEEEEEEEEGGAKKGMDSSKELCMILYGIMCILDFGRVSKPRV